MIDLTTLENLQRLRAVPLPVLASLDVVKTTSGLATRFVRAHTFLAHLLSVTPEVGLLVLSTADWASYAHPAFPHYGLTHYDSARQLIITGVQSGDFLQPALTIMQTMAKVQYHELTQVYGLRNGRIDLATHVDTYVVHDLGHAFHLHVGYWFPRRWLMEYFADLCAYTYIAAHEPEQLSALQTFPQALGAIPPTHWPLRTLHDFDAYYGKAEMSVENYLWFHGHLFGAAQQEYQSAGVQALHQMWQTFVVGNIQAVTDEQLITLLTTIQPYLAQLLRREVTNE